MKKSCSGSLINIKSNNLIAGSGITGFTLGFNQSNEQANNLEFELERRRETIMKLRSHLLSKQKEISILKVQKNKADDEHQRILRNLEEILKQSDQSTAAGFKAVESIIYSNIEINNNKKELRLDEVKNMIHLNEDQKMILKEIIYADSLKQQINVLNDEINKKEKIINKIKKNNNNANLSRMQNNFIKNYYELAQMKKQNELIRKKMEVNTNMLVAVKEDNLNLKNNLQELQQKFRDYKALFSKRNKSLENNLKKAREKERNCKIFHVKKNKINNSNSNTIDYSKLLNNSNNIQNNEENTKSNLNENDIKLSEVEQEMKKLSNNLKKLKREINNKNKEKRQLNNEKLLLNNEIRYISNDNNKYLNQINNLNKQIQDLNTNNNNIEKENNNLKQKIEEIDTKFEDEKLKYTGLKEIMAEKENEINDLKKMIENLKNNNKDDLFFTGIGAIGKKKDENLETDKNIAEELAQIEKKLEQANQDNFDGDLS